MPPYAATARGPVHHNDATDCGQRSDATVSRGRGGTCSRDVTGVRTSIADSPVGGDDALDDQRPARWRIRRFQSTTTRGASRLQYAIYSRSSDCNQLGTKTLFIYWSPCTMRMATYRTAIPRGMTSRPPGGCDENQVNVRLRTMLTARIISKECTVLASSS